MNGDDCKFSYMNHMLAEHRRLDALIRGTLASFPTWEEHTPGNWLKQFRQRLDMIRNELTHHFRDEEQGGCLEEAVARCPALSAEVERLQLEHPELLARIDELRGRAARMETPTVADAHALREAFWKLVRDVRAHEARENGILQRGFNINVNGDSPAARALGHAE